MWDGWQVIRFDPDGKEMMRVEVPVQLTTCCIFGGADLRDLYITTASVGLSQKEIQDSFQAGNLFRFRADVAGLPSHPFG
jgi:sugar lactone lactonase YvrE